MIDEILKEMIFYSKGNKKDIAHFLKVHEFAMLIGKQEMLDEKTQRILEISAIIHDIACPLCREKYGNTNGKYQEKEGKALAEEFLKPFDLSTQEKERIVYLVSHHHTYQCVDGLDYQILLEADFLVNADEMNASKEAIKNMKEKVFQTHTGLVLLESIY